MSDSKRWTVTDDVLASHLDGEAVLLHMDTKDFFRLNATAASVWKGLERGMDREGLVEKLCKEFEVEPGPAGEELDHLLGELARRRLIVEAAAG